MKILFRYVFIVAAFSSFAMAGDDIGMHHVYLGQAYNSRLVQKLPAFKMADQARYDSPQQRSYQLSFGETVQDQKPFSGLADAYAHAAQEQYKKLQKDIADSHKAMLEKINASFDGLVIKHSSFSGGLGDISECFTKITIPLFKSEIQSTSQAEGQGMWPTPWQKSALEGFSGF